MNAVPAFQCAIGSDLTEVGPAVDRVLAEARRFLPDGARGISLEDDLRIGLTEALNNCVLHAYGGAPGGTVTIDLCPAPDAVRLSVIDRGSPPPMELVAAAPDPLFLGDLDELPEGGWGWFLIHRSVDNVSFVQEDGLNRLTLERRF